MGHVSDVPHEQQRASLVNQPAELFNTIKCSGVADSTCRCNKGRGLGDDNDGAIAAKGGVESGLDFTHCGDRRLIVCKLLKCRRWGAIGDENELPFMEEDFDGVFHGQGLQGLEQVGQQE